MSNWNRRKVSREEKEEWINGLARIYQKQGVTSIPSKIMDVTGLKKDTVYNYLDSKFKRKIDYPKREPIVPASQVIVKHMGDGYGQELVERFREEVLAEEKLSPEEKQKLEAERQRKREEEEQKKQEQKRKNEETKAHNLLSQAWNKIQKAEKANIDVTVFLERYNNATLPSCKLFISYL